MGRAVSRACTAAARCGPARVHAGGQGDAEGTGDADGGGAAYGEPHDRVDDVVDAGQPEGTGLRRQCGLVDHDDPAVHPVDRARQHRLSLERQAGRRGRAAPRRLDTREVRSRVRKGPQARPEPVIGWTEAGRRGGAWRRQARRDHQLGAGSGQNWPELHPADDHGPRDQGGAGRGQGWAERTSREPGAPESGLDKGGAGEPCRRQAPGLSAMITSSVQKVTRTGRNCTQLMITGPGSGMARGSGWAGQGGAVAGVGRAGVGRCRGRAGRGRGGPGSGGSGAGQSASGWAGVGLRVAAGRAAVRRAGAGSGATVRRRDRAGDEIGRS